MSQLGDRPETRNAAIQEQDRFFTIPLEMLAIISTDSRFKRLNPSFYQVLGWSESEMLNQPTRHFIHPDDLEASLAAQQRLHEGEPILRFENRYRCKDGSYRLLSWSCAPFLEAGLIYAVARDITQERQQQRSLEFLLELHQAIHALSEPEQILSVMTRRLGEFLAANRCSYGEVDQAAGEFHVISDYTHETISLQGRMKIAAFGAEPWRLLLAGEPYLLEDAETDPLASPRAATYRQLEIRALMCLPLLRQGQLVAALALHHKQPRRWLPEEIELVRIVLTLCWSTLERSKSARDLKDSEARLRFLAESMPQKIFSATPEGEITYFNALWMDFTGLSARQIQAGPWPPALHPEDRQTYEQSWRHALGSGEPLECEHRLQRADGVYRWHLCRARAMPDTDGQLLIWIGSVTDIHDLKLAQAEKQRLLQEAQEASRLKDEFLSTVSHELRTPLNAILGWAELIREEDAHPAEIRHGLQVIDQCARLQTRLIEDLLDVERMRSGTLSLSLEPLELKGLILAALELVQPKARAKQIQLGLALERQPVRVLGDAGRLQQIVWNLLSNALKFTPAGGRIELSLTASAAHARLTLTDTGQGIAAEFLPQVFERFRQADASPSRAAGGLGLGLTIVRRLVELHHGEIVIRSPGPGCGTTVEVTLPLSS